MSKNSSAFVEDSDSFDVIIHFKEQNGETVVLAEKEEGCQSLTITFRYPDFGIAQNIVEASTALGENGMPTINYLALQNTMLYTLAQKWDAKDSKDKAMPIDQIGKLKVNIAKAIVEKLISTVGPTAIL